MQDFRKLLVWQKARQLAIEIHRVMNTAPRGRFVGLRAQALRAAASIPANLAEGCGRRSRGDLARFTDVAIGSASELENHLTLAADLGALPEEQCRRLIALTAEIRRMLWGLSSTVRAAALKEKSAK